MIQRRVTGRDTVGGNNKDRRPGGEPVDAQAVNGIELTYPVLIQAFYSTFFQSGHYTALWTDIDDFRIFISEVQP
jgi:hypothetical protein